MAHLEENLQQASDARRKLIATDGVFSMDGYVAPLREICELAERYDAMVMVDDSHAVGFVGEHDLLRQRSRPYLFSNSLAPAIAAASLVVLELLAESDGLRARLKENTLWFRERMTGLGFDVLPGDHPIVPVMFGDAARAARMADLLLHRGVYVVGFSYPVVPIGKARIRAQLSAAHTRDDLERATTAFDQARAELT